MRLRNKVGLNQSRTLSTTNVSVHNQYIKRKKLHQHGVKTGSQPYTCPPTQSFDPPDPQDRRHCYYLPSLQVPLVFSSLFCFPSFPPSLHCLFIPRVLKTRILPYGTLSNLAGHRMSAKWSPVVALQVSQRVPCVRVSLMRRTTQWNAVMSIEW